MPINFVYLVIHSQSFLPSPKDEPCFRVVNTTLPNLPARWTDHDYGKHKYIDIRVIASGTRLAEESKIELEHIFPQDVKIVGWRNTLGAAVEKLTNSVMDDCGKTEEEGEGVGKDFSRRGYVVWRR
jgi:hypothetical protein